MRYKSRRKRLVYFDILLSICSILTGSLMLQSGFGVFHEYPKEWLLKLPFSGWAVPGILTIVIFGFGNLLSAIFAIKKEDGRAWIMSAVMGITLFICLAAQVIILREMYLADYYILIAGIVQVFLSGSLLIYDKSKTKHLGGFMNEQ